MDTFYQVQKTIKKYKPQYLLVYGRRSRGKSWSSKELCIDEFMKTGRTFVYLRRYGEDIKPSNALQYWSKFQGKVFEKLTHGKYNEMTARANTYYLGNGDNKELCGYFLDLNHAERWKSQEFPRVKYIIFEEFITNQIYLDDEANELLNLVSTIARNETDVVVIMLGNAISRVCPYFNEWGIGDIVNQQQGTVKIFNLLSESGNTRIVTERTFDTQQNNGTTLFFGNSEKSIMQGEWDVADVPIRPKEKKEGNEFTTHYEIAFSHMGFDFIIQLQSDTDGNLFVFIYPNKYNREIERKVHKGFSLSALESETLNRNNRAECIISDLWNKGKYCFSDKLTGNDFLQVNKMYESLFILR